MFAGSRKAFTLIELLVVIAIISILAAILFPALITARRAGQAKACLENAKQLGMASVIYAGDHDDCLVPSITGESEKDDPYYPNRRYWTKLLFPYVKSVAAYVCPSMKREAGAYNGLTESMATTYAMNSIVISCDSWRQGTRRHRVSDYAKTSRIILLTEIRHGHWATGSQILIWNDLITNLKYYGPTWHNGMLNIAFMDGHARTMYLYDTIGDTPGEWMWHDPSANPEAGSLGSIAKEQSDRKAEWPHDYPPFGG